jgi:hypothetical protein
MKIPIRKVSKHAGKNLVGQALAKQALAKALVDQKIALYMLENGEPCAEMLSGIAGTLQIIQIACQIDSLVGLSVSQLKGALNAAIALTLSNSYDSTQTAAIVQGLVCAEELIYKVKPASVNIAWHKMQTRST